MNSSFFLLMLFAIIIIFAFPYLLSVLAVLIPIWLIYIIYKSHKIQKQHEQAYRHQQGSNANNYQSQYTQTNEKRGGDVIDVEFTVRDEDKEQ